MAKYGKKAQKLVKATVTKFKSGKLKSGRARTPVKSLKQAIAIALSKARKAGAKMPRYKGK